MPRYRDLLQITEAQREELTKWSQSRTLPAGDVFRAKVILALADGWTWAEIAVSLRTTKKSQAIPLDVHRSPTPHHSISVSEQTTARLQAIPKMTSEEFVRAVKIQTSDAAVHGTVAILEKPVGRKPREQDVRLSEWYARISEADQQMVQLALKESAELAVFEFFCVLDGVAVIEDTPEKGDLELYFIKNSERTRVNLPAGEELHNIFNRLCDESPSSAVQNPDLASGDSGEAAQIKNKPPTWRWHGYPSCA